ncbi:hypothetical protein GCM10020000_04830 [Streptomyces olivoverticillatus]
MVEADDLSVALGRARGRALDDQVVTELRVHVVTASLPCLREAGLRSSSTTQPLDLWKGQSDIRCRRRLAQTCAVPRTDQGSLVSEHRTRARTGGRVIDMPLGEQLPASAEPPHRGTMEVGHQGADAPNPG